LAGEPLEDRRVLSVFGLGINLYEDDGGVPGNLIADDTVQVGESFFVEITAHDTRAQPSGIAGLSLDVDWDGSVLTEIDAVFDPTDPNTELVTAKFPVFRSGVLDADAPSAKIAKLTGASLPGFGLGETLGAGFAERFSLLHFRADAIAEASPLDLRIRYDGVGFTDASAVSMEEIDIDPQVVNVVPAATLPFLVVSDATTVETTETDTDIVFDVIMSAPSNEPVTISYATESGTAEADADFQPVIGSIVLEPGVTAASIRVSVIGDAIDESDEMFHLQLTGAANATLADDTAIGTILDDDIPVTPEDDGNDPPPAGRDVLDVNNDGFVSALDSLVIINELTDNGAHILEHVPTDGPFLDVNGDGAVTRLDALIVVNFVNYGIRPLHAVASPSAVVDSPALSESALDSLASTAVSLWSDAGANAEQRALLTTIDIRVADLPGDLLGTAVGRQITIDRDAAGAGWYVVPTPATDAEPENVAVQAGATGAPHARAGCDLLTVLAHEMGHVLGLGDIADTSDSPSLMASHLSPGIRRLPSARDVDSVFAKHAAW
jgi:hypothetical protein